MFWPRYLNDSSTDLKKILSFIFVKCMKKTSCPGPPRVTAILTPRVCLDRRSPFALLSLTSVDQVPFETVRHRRTADQRSDSSPSLSPHTWRSSPVLTRGSSIRSVWDRVDLGQQVPRFSFKHHRYLASGNWRRLQEGSS